MSAPGESLSLLDRIRRTLVGLKMPRALELLDHTVRQLERGEASALEAIDALLAEELTLRESRRIKTALMMARLSTIKTLAGFDFSACPAAPTKASVCCDLRAACVSASAKSAGRKFPESCRNQPQTPQLSEAWSWRRRCDGS